MAGNGGRGPSGWHATAKSFCSGSGMRRAAHGPASSSAGRTPRRRPLAPPRGGLNPHPEQGEPMRSSWAATSSTPGRGFQVQVRDGAQGLGRRQPRSPRPPARVSATPVPPTTRGRAARWNRPGAGRAGARAARGRAAPTSSPSRSSPGPESSWPPIPGLRPAQPCRT